MTYDDATAEPLSISEEEAFDLSRAALPPPLASGCQR